MGDTKNLDNTEAIEKISELVKEIGSCMFCTYRGSKLESRPMSVQQVDNDGNLWFLSDKNSNKNSDIAANDNVELFFSQGHTKFLAIHGKASVSYDREVIKELYEPIVKVWMKGGEDDPNLCAIKVDFEDGYYWDIKNSKMVAMAKMAISLVSGKTMDDGIEGKLVS
jgi:general stress protein 26